MSTKLTQIIFSATLLLATVCAAPASSTKAQKIDNSVTNNNNSHTAAISGSGSAKFNLKWTPRNGWHAAAPTHPPTAINADGGGGRAASHVIIHHTATSATGCRSSAAATACATVVRAIQRGHQQDRGWDDIGYNFLIGGSDERAEIYEGRGFGVAGAHAVGYNARSVGIALIGDWTAELPPRTMLDKLKQLISYGVQMGHIQRNYTLLGHRQVKATACPGARLYEELKEWPHFAQHATATASR